MGYSTVQQTGGGQGKGTASNVATNSTNGSSSVGGSPGGKGHMTYPSQGGQPQMGMPPTTQVATQNNPTNQYQNTIQPWNVSGMTGQNSSGKGKGH